MHKPPAAIVVMLACWRRGSPHVERVVSRSWATPRWAAVSPCSAPY